MKTTISSRVYASIMTLLDEGMTVEMIAKRKRVTVEAVLDVKKNYDEVKSWFQK